MTKILNQSKLLGCWRSSTRHSSFTCNNNNRRTNQSSSPSSPSVNGGQMSFTLRKSTIHPIAFRHLTLSQFQLHPTTTRHGQFSQSLNHRSILQRQGRGRRGQQMFLPRCSSVSMSRMLHPSLHRDLHRPHCQVQAVLSHPTSLHLLQEKLLVSNSRALNNSRAFSVLPTCEFHPKTLFLNSRSFCGVTGGDEIDSDAESDIDANVDCDFDEGDGTEGVKVESGADVDEVNRVCKVIDELFALDRNMEAVLDECKIILSHELVVDVLYRFRHARRPAYRFFGWAGQKEGFSHDSRTYNSMMAIFGKTRQFETMVAFLEEMGEKGLLTIETFSIAIKAFAAAKERKKAVGIFELMKKYNFKVGVDTINCLLDNLGRAKLAKEAQAVFEKLQHRFTPNLRTYTVLLNGWCGVKNLLEAGRVWNEMIDKGFKPDIIAYNTMIEGLLRGQKKLDAIKLIEVMKAKGPAPNVRSYTILIRDLCKHTKMKEAVEYLDEMIVSGCQPDAAVYTCLITGFGNQKKMDKVYGLLKEMREKGFPPDGHTYNALIKLMTNRGMPYDAARIYDKMVQNGVQPTIHTYNMLMKSYFQTRNYDMGVAVWEEMNQKGCCPDDNSYTVFIGGLIRHGKSEEACRYVEEMIEKGMKAPQLDYNKFTADFSRAGKPDILEELAQKMKFAGKMDVSNVFARWAEMTKKRVKRRDPVNTERQYT